MQLNEMHQEKRRGEGPSHVFLKLSQWTPGHWLLVSAIQKTILLLGNGLCCTQFLPVQGRNVSNPCTNIFTRSKS